LGKGPFAPGNPFDKTRLPVIQETEILAKPRHCDDDLRNIRSPKLPVMQPQPYTIQATGEINLS